MPALLFLLNLYCINWFTQSTQCLGWQNLHKFQKHTQVKKNCFNSYTLQHRKLLTYCHMLNFPQRQFARIIKTIFSCQNMRLSTYLKCLLVTVCHVSGCHSSTYLEEQVVLMPCYDMMPNTMRRKIGGGKAELYKIVSSA